MTGSRFAVAILGLGVASFAADVKISVRDLPPAIQKALSSHLEGAKIVAASKEQEHDGSFTYEVETKHDGKGRDLTFDEKGTLLEVEQEVDMDQAPADVRKALQDRANGGTIEKLESVTKGSKTSYEADVKMANGKRKEIAVNADGSPHQPD